MKSIKTVCSACLECCKRYDITLLPEEAEKIRKKLNLSEKEFVRKYCSLSLQFFPATKSKNPFVFSKAKISEKIRKKLKEKSTSNYFFLLPNISLKKSKKCVFLKNSLCEIHSVKPKQCKLFPFISLKKETAFWKKYPFCDLLKEGFKPEKDFKEKSVKHYSKVKNYFDSVKEKGFLSVWKEIPKKGFYFFKDEKIEKISKKEFLQAIETFK